MRKLFTLLFITLFLGTGSVMADNLRAYSTGISDSNSNISYNSETKTWTWSTTSANQLTIFSFTAGTLSKFSTINWVSSGSTITEDIPKYRVIFYNGGNNVKEISLYSDGIKNISLTANMSADQIASITAIKFSGSNKATGSTVVDLDGIYLESSKAGIADATDWSELKDIVAAGLNKVNVEMTADVTVSDGTMIGTSSKPYEGTFDGKGHTLTFTYNNESSDGIAPFQCINNATINDLFTSGSITARNVFGGIVGTAGGNSTLNRCSSNMELIAKHGSDTNNGRVAGLVGRCADNASPAGTSITLNYCQYTGSINSDLGNRACGLVAWLRNGTLNAKNCFINPSSVTNGAENCSATGGTSPTTNITSCYYTKQFGSSTQGSAATLDQLESGELAYMLNDGNSGTLFFGQKKLNTSIASTVPELTSDETEKVIKITFSHNGSLKQYTNKGGVLPSPTPTSIKALSYYDASKGSESNPYFSLNEDKQVNRNYKRFPLTISSAGATTLVLPVNVKTLPDGVKAYNLEYTSGDKVTAEEVTSITANCPVLINAEPGNYVFVSDNDSEITYDTENAHQNGALFGVYTDTYKYVPANSYVLQDGKYGPGFYKVAEEKPIKITSFRAYLTPNMPGARSFIGIDDGTTGIQNSVKVENKDFGDDVIYNLSGQVVTNPGKGIYIKNGKKFIVK